MHANHTELGTLQQYVEVLERENSSHRAESIYLHQHIERISVECEHLRNQSFCQDPNQQSRLLIQKQIEIAMLREGHERWVNALHSELEDFKRRYETLTSGEPERRWHHQPTAVAPIVETINTRTYEETVVYTNSEPVQQEQLHRQLDYLRSQLQLMSSRLAQERAQLHEQHRRQTEQLRSELLRPHDDWNYQRNELLLQQQSMDQQIVRLRKELEDARSNSTISTVSGGLRVRVHEPIRIVANSGSSYDQRQKNQQIEQLKSDRLRLQNELSSANQTIRELADERNARESVITRLERQRSSQLEQMATLHREMDKLTTSRVQSTQPSNTSDEIYIRRLQEEKLNHQADAFRLRGQLQTSREQASLLRREVATQRSQHLAEYSQLKTELDHARAQMSSVDVKLLQTRHESQLNSLASSLTTLKEQFDREKQQLIQVLTELEHKDKASTDTIFNLTTELERHIRIREEGKQSQAEIDSLRQELRQLKQINYQLTNNSKESEVYQSEYLSLLNCNRQLERRVYVLENANYSLSQELTKRSRLLSGKGTISQTLSGIKQEIINYKETHASSKERKVQRCSQQTVIRKRVNIVNPQHINVQDKSQQNERVTITANHRRANKSPQERSPVETPTHSRRGSIIGDLSSKLKNIKSENEQLKRSLADMHSRSSRQSRV